MTKQWFTSKTLWFNILTGLVFLATAFFGYQPNDVVTHNLTAVVENPLFIVVVNFVLRLITKKAVSLSAPQFPTIDTAPPQA